MIRVDVQQQLGAFALDVAFDAPVGVTALFGRSGSGKTSVINAIAGLTRPDAGRIELNDRTLFDRRICVPPHKRRIGYVFQDARLFPHMTVAQNLHYGGSHDADAVIALLGLSDVLERRPARLSGGEKQRVALGRALMSNPQLLLMDEPLAALDTARKAEILPYLEALRDRADVPIIYVSHAISEVTRLANTLVVLQAGKVMQAGPVADVLADPASVKLLGRYDAGALLTATVQAHDPVDALTIVTTAAGEILLQGQVGRPGDVVRLRVPAQDIILSLERPTGISALNALPVTITEIAKGDGPAMAIGLLAGQERLLAQISDRSVRAMDLAPGRAVYAIFKVTAATPDLKVDAVL